MATDTLAEKKRKAEQLQLELNILKLETRILEMDEEKQKILESIDEQKARLEQMKGGK